MWWSPAVAEKMNTCLPFSLPPHHLCPRVESGDRGKEGPKEGRETISSVPPAKQQVCHQPELGKCTLFRGTPFDLSPHIPQIEKSEKMTFESCLRFSSANFQLLDSTLTDVEKDRNIQFKCEIVNDLKVVE